MEKVRHLEGTEKHFKDAGEELQITLEADKDAGTVTLTDRGIGMTREELIENLGTIAHSGTKAFLEQIKANGGSSSGLIGQFGVGFYSAFMVADKVEVFSRSWREDAESLRWESDGKTGYEIEKVDELPRGVKIVLHLNEASKEFADDFRIKGLIKRYSNFVGFPILIDGKRVNEVEALWLKSKSDITDEQYKEFYQFACKGFDDPSYRLHFSADAPIAINALIFTPGENPEKMGFGKVDNGVALYCKKVLIDPEPKGLLPDWLRFVKGVVDSADLPLNISRETMQDSALVRKLNGVITKRIIKMFEKESAADPAKYRDFYKKFERFFKEGIATDFSNKDALAKLLRFETSMTDAGEVCSLTDYVGRMKDGQEKIYYLIGQNRDQIESGPYVEAFKARGLEVIYFTDAVDEYVVDSLGEFDGKKLASVRHAGVDLEDVDSDADSLSEEQINGLCEFLKNELGEKVTKVSSGKRLVESPVIALVPEDGMSPQVRQMMKAMDENFKDEVKVELEINPRHALIKKLSETRESHPEVAKLVAAQMLDNALISAGLLDDAREMIRRMNALMEKAMQ
jgi:molecular chaperone HtpG